jgi:hypothetical protein
LAGDAAAISEGRRDLLTDEIVEFLFLRVLEPYIDLLREPWRIREGVNEYAQNLRQTQGRDRPEPHLDPELWARLADVIILRPLVEVVD